MLQAEDAVGETITEVGIGYDSSHCVTHALLEDMNGNPVSIEKTAADVIKIYATVYVHFGAGGWYNGSIVVAPLTNNSGLTTHTSASVAAILLGRCKTLSSIKFTVSAGKRTGAVTAQSGDGTSAAVDTQNKTVTITRRIAAAELNAPIRAIVLRDVLYTQGQLVIPSFWLVPGTWFTPPAITAESVGTGDGSALGFATAFPVKTGSKVYVDGVEASGVTFRAGPADLTRLGEWMNACYKTDAGVPGYYNDNYGSSASLSGGLSLGMLNSGVKTRPLENSFSGVGIEKVQVLRAYDYISGQKKVEILASDDLANWTSAGQFVAAYDAPTDCTVPQALRSKRYWQIQNVSDRDLELHVKFFGEAADRSHNIVFSTAPASGAVITADYTPDCIAKDENHVFDLTLVLTLGEYQEE